MTTVSDITTSLAERTRPELAAVWDPVGLQLGDPAASVESVAVCHEVTEEVVSAIEADPVDLVVTYHPLLFEPVNRILAGRSAGARALRLLKVGVSLLVTHTDFDAAPGGMADSLAWVFKLRGLQVFGSDADEGLPGIGRVGEFDGGLAAVDAIAADVFGSSGLRVSGDPSLEVERLAVIPGSGSRFVEEAAQLADALVTGDVSHHQAVRALDLGLAIVDPGHIATERPGMSALRNLVSDVVSFQVTDLTDLDPSTW